MMAWTNTGNIKGPKGDPGTGVSPGDVLVNPTIDNYTEAPYAIGVVTSSCALDLTNGTVQMATLTPFISCLFAMPPPVAGKSFVLMLSQPGALGGNGAAAFDDVQWNLIGAPVISIAPGALDILSFFSDGTNWYGSYSQGYSTGFDSNAGARTSIRLPRPGGGWTYPLLRVIRRAMQSNNNV